MNQRTVQSEGVNAKITREANGQVTIVGQMTKFAGAAQQIRWIAAQKPQRGIGFNGSGLPYHNADQAFDGTPFKGTISSPDGSFTIVLETLPSAYYTGLGSVYVPPVVILESLSNGPEKNSYRTHLFLSPVGVPYRWTAGAPPGPRAEPRVDQVGRAMFYNGREELGLFQNQEALLRYRGYPADEASQRLPDRIDSNPWVKTPSPA